MLDSKWWDGKRWRASDDGPNTAAEARAYKTALDVLAELNQAMIGDGPVNGAARVAAARRFGRSAEADLERGTHTEKEADAYVIYEAAIPLLRQHPRRPPWTKLAAELTHQLIGKRLYDPTVTPNRLRMICRQRGAK